MWGAAEVVVAVCEVMSRFKVRFMVRLRSVMTIGALEETNETI